ncbi:Hint domain-containing protein [Lichenicoccus sp.]|uniref:Hint domain-containing protein n=1 Tax=Lichenicoccus sp. TaxID=2781899 RepID=UPI003D138A30
MTTTWTGNTTGTNYWDLAGNWSTGVVPGAGSNLSILGTGPFSVVITNTDRAYAINSLSLGGTGSSPTLQVLGRLSVTNGITAAGGSALDIGTTGSVSASSLDLTGVTVIDQGLLTISGTASGSGTVDVEGGSLFINTISGINTYDLTGSANMTITDSAGGSGAIVFGDTSPISLNLNVAGTAFGASITGFGAADTIDIGSLAWTRGETVSVNGTALTISSGGKTVFTFNDFNSPGKVRVESDGNGGTELYTCFLAGTRILTDQGEVAVEELAVRDMVATLTGGRIVYRPIRWIGSRTLDRSAIRRTGAHPVRFRAGALSDGVPHRDLLVTPEHCILVDGGLVPARMLVNGRSIFVDHSVGAFSFHHVELEQHGILIAEGLTTESYLDTGNRCIFAPAAAADVVPLADLVQSHDQSTRRHQSCAPVQTSRAAVEPLWQRLDGRAAARGWPDQRPVLELTGDPRLRLRLEGGRQIAALWNDGGRHIFHIPVGARPVQLLSRVSIPAINIGPFVDDRRALGVQVSTVVHWNGLLDTVMPAEAIQLEGWHAAEGGLRWTDGAARLDLPAASSADTFVEVRVVNTLPYQQPVAFSRLAA